MKQPAKALKEADGCFWCKEPLQADAQNRLVVVYTPQEEQEERWVLCPPCYQELKDWVTQ